MQALPVRLLKALHIISDNRSFFCLLFFPKKSRLFQFCYCHAGVALAPVADAEIRNALVGAEECLNGFAEGSRALSVYNAYFVHARTLCVVNIFVKRKLGVVSVHSAKVNLRRERRGGADGGFCSALGFLFGALVEHKIFDFGFHYRRADSDSDISCGIRLGNDFSVLSDADYYDFVSRNRVAGENISFCRPFDDGVERVFVFAQFFAYLCARFVHFLA